MCPKWKLGGEGAVQVGRCSYGEEEGSAAVNCPARAAVLPEE